MKSQARRLLTLAIALAGATNALANQPPGPMVMLSEVLLLPVMMLCTALGGGYAILRRIQKRNLKGAKIFGAVVVIVMSGMHEAFGALAALVFGCLVLVRAIRMIRWSRQCASTAEPPEHLEGADSRKLMVAASVLIVAAVFLVGMAFSFVGYWPGIGQANREQGLKEFLTYQLAYSRVQQADRGKPAFADLPEPTGRGYGGAYYRFTKEIIVRLGEVEINSDAAAGRYEIHMLPSGRFPSFPYNYLTSQPSYYADQSGKIRMIRVHHDDAKCPADAPVVMEVSEADIEAMMPTIVSAAKATSRTDR